MAFLQKQLKKEDIQSQGSSNYIGKSGIYDVTIKTVSVSTSKNGATALDFNLEYNGESTTIYGMYITDRTGKESFGMKTFYQLCGIAGLVDSDGAVSVNDPEEQTHKLGKDGKEVELLVLEDFTDTPVKVRVQEEYSINPNKNEIQKRMSIKSFYRQEDGASAEEILTESAVGVQLEKDMKYAENVTYKDGLTPEAVAEWKESKKSGSNTASAAATTAKPKAKGPVKFV